MHTPGGLKAAEAVLNDARSKGKLERQVGQEIVIDPVTGLYGTGVAATSALSDAMDRAGVSPYGTYHRWYRGIISAEGDRTVLTNVGEFRNRAKDILEEG